MIRALITCSLLTFRHRRSLTSMHSRYRVALRYYRVVLAIMIIGRTNLVSVLLVTWALILLLTARVNVSLRNPLTYLLKVRLRIRPMRRCRRSLIVRRRILSVDLRRTILLRTVMRSVRTIRRDRWRMRVTRRKKLIRRTSSVRPRRLMASTRRRTYYLCRRLLRSRTSFLIRSIFARSTSSIRVRLPWYMRRLSLLRIRTAVVLVAVCLALPWYTRASLRPVEVRRVPLKRRRKLLRRSTLRVTRVTRVASW